MNCPRCGTDNGPASVECVRCGVILAKAARLQEPAERGLPPPAVVEIERVADGRIGPAELALLVIGLVAAIVVYAFPSPGLSSRR